MNSPSLEPNIRWLFAVLVALLGVLFVINSTAIKFEPASVGWGFILLALALIF